MPPTKSNTGKTLAEAVDRRPSRKVRRRMEHSLDDLASSESKSSFVTTRDNRTFVHRNDVSGGHVATLII